MEQPAESCRRRSQLKDDDEHFTDGNKCLSVQKELTDRRTEADTDFTPNGRRANGLILKHTHELHSTACCSNTESPVLHEISHQFDTHNYTLTPRDSSTAAQRDI